MGTVSCVESPAMLNSKPNMLKSVSRSFTRPAHKAPLSVKDLVARKNGCKNRFQVINWVNGKDFLFNGSRCANAKTKHVYYFFL